MTSIYAIVLLCCFNVYLCQPTMDEAPDGRSGKLTFKPPPLSDEDSHSSFMPAYLKCDACYAISYQMKTQLDKANNRLKSLKGNLPESEILEAFEEACASKTYESYGLKEVKKVKRLSGDGIAEAVKDEPGMMQGGGKWPGRMVDMCETFIGELGETMIYEHYLKSRDEKNGFRKFLCYGKAPWLNSCKNKKKDNKDEL